MSGFSKNLRAIMDEKKITNETIANKMGVSVSTVTHWSNGRRFPRKDTTIKSLLNALQVESNDLFGSENELPVKTIPLIGVASCGVPTIAFNDFTERIPVEAGLARDGVYAVRADGDSMLSDIKHGDIIICDKNMTCEVGNIVHYTTIDGESGLKKYTEKDDVVTLYPLNQNGEFQPIVIAKQDLKCARAFKRYGDL